jgi:hypothetical protein
MNRIFTCLSFLFAIIIVAVLAGTGVIVGLKRAKALSK